MKQTPALVLVTTSFPIAGDGSEAAGSFVSDLVDVITESMPVRVVAPGHASERRRWGRSVDIYRYAAPSKPLSTLKPWVPTQLAQICNLLSEGAKSTRQAVGDGATAHVLALWALPSGYWARNAARQAGVPYSVWTLGSDIWALGKVPLVRGYLHRILAGAHTCYSDGLRLANDTYRIARRRVEFLPSTRRIERTRTAELRKSPPYRLLFLGRWHRNKGIDLLLDALRLLEADAWRRIECVEICGGGPMESTVSAGVDALRAMGRPLELRGFLDKAAAEEAMLNADYVLIPSRVESIPVVFSDAMKLGCPVVSMPTGDLPHLVASMPACGTLADAISAECFASAISRAVMQSPAIFAAGTRARANQFDLDSAAHRIVQGLGKHGNA